MQNADLSSASLPLTGSYLDVGPMIKALRSQPTDFEYKRGWLRHVPSQHQFRIGQRGQVTVYARCNCAGQSVTHEQGEELFQAFKAWRQFYWTPLAINREFESHFRAPGPWTRFLRDIRMAWRRLRRQEAAATVPDEHTTVAPAE